jgi:hypothetical protein
MALFDGIAQYIDGCHRGWDRQTTFYETIFRGSLVHP